MVRSALDALLGLGDRGLYLDADLATGVASEVDERRVLRELHEVAERVEIDLGHPNVASFRKTRRTVAFDHSLSLSLSLDMCIYFVPTKTQYVFFRSTITPFPYLKRLRGATKPMPSNWWSVES